MYLNMSVLDASHSLNLPKQNNIANLKSGNGKTAKRIKNVNLHLIIFLSNPT